jgi:DNA polymerase III alpha subunit
VIESLSRRTLEAILHHRPFASLEDLVARACPKEAEAEHLIRSGALDFTGLPRNHLLWKLMTAYRDMRQPAWMCREGSAGYAVGRGDKRDSSYDRGHGDQRGSSYDRGPGNKRESSCNRKPGDNRDQRGLGFAPPGPAPVRPIAVPDLPETDPKDRWKEEWRIMGFTCGDHPVRAFRDDLARAGALPSIAIPKSKGRPIRLGGIIAAQRRTRTDRGELMQFLTLDDEAGIFEVVLFPDVYRRTRFVLDGPGPYIVDGRPEDNYGAVAVNAWNLEALG